jgi:hypothetical protein
LRKVAQQAHQYKGVHSLEKGQLASASIEEEFMHLIKVNQYDH